MRVSPPAKINLHLRVGPPAANGFHPLLSWMVTVGLFDNLELTLSDHPGTELRCDDPAIPTDASNLIVKTANGLLETIAASPTDRPAVTGLAAALQKRIPVGAGLGGGSSDGAFALIALDRLLDLHWPPHRLADLAARFGSDLSFFFHGPSSICTGRGEVVHPTPPPAPRHALLILPGIHMPTPAVYRRFDEMKLGRAEDLATQPDWRHLSTLGANDLLPHLVNDLEPPAFSINPELAALHSRAAQALDRIVRMSGSGSTLFTLYDTQEESSRAAEKITSTLHVRALSVDLCPPDSVQPPGLPGASGRPTIDRNIHQLK